MTTTPSTRTVVELAEYQRRRVDALPPTEADVRLAERLMGNDDTTSGIAVRWLANGQVDITASSCVGVVRFSDLDIHVVPKLVGGSLRVLRMLDYAAGVSMLRRLPLDRPLPANGSDLFDLICLLLAKESEDLVRDGLLRDYRATEETLVVLRGRLRHRDQYLRRFGQLDRLECSFDEYDSNTPDNQLVAAALTAARRRAQDQGIRFSLARLHGVFAEACESPTTDANWYETQIQYGRRNARYRAAHELSKLVLRGLAFDDLYDTTSGAVTAFLLDMNSVFEKFASRLLSDALAGSALHPSMQHRLRAVIRNDRTNRSYSTIKPDVVVEELATGRKVPIDIKYKQYSNKKISTSDIYQTFLYAYVLGVAPAERRAGLLYPTTTATLGPRLSIKPTSGPTAAQLVGEGIDVPAVLDALLDTDREPLLVEVRRLVESLTGLNP